MIYYTIYTMIQQLFLFCLVLSSLTISTTAFSPLLNALSSPSECSARTNEGVALCMGKKKPSMAERRKRRSTKSLGGPNPYADLPSPNLDFSRDEVDKADEPIKVANPEAAAKKAKELLRAQRESVNMLTKVKEQIVDRFSDVEFRKALETDGFAVVDGFFNKDGDDASASILDQLRQEGATMLDDGDTEVDTANLGKGQYVITIKGGDQYAKCPRMVEIVVSSTKHISETFGESEDEENASDDDGPESGHEPSILDLDASACMATLRIFDRKALKASLVLLTGSDDDSALDVPGKEATLAVIADQEDDKRRLSLHYYIVPSAWNEQCGGGLEFEGGARVDAKEDRIVVFYSDKTKCKAIPWKGSDDSPELAIGNSIELHLIEKRQ